MNNLLTLILSALLLTAHAQTPSATPATPTTLTRVKRAETLGQKMVQQSKPTDTVLPHKVIKK